MSVILLFILFVIWYRLPIQVHQSTYVSTLDGKQVKAELDVAWHRYLFKPTELRGSITFDGKKYINYYDLGMQNGNGFLDQLSSKLTNGINVPMFAIPRKDGWIDLGNSISIWIWDDTFKTIHLFAHKEDGSQEEYVGPARTAEEAQLVFTKIKQMIPSD